MAPLDDTPVAHHHDRNPEDAGHGVDLSGISSHALLRLYADILTSLNARGVLRSRNAPAGDLAEYLVAVAYGGTLAAQSKKSWDVAAPDGRLLQVKSRVVEPGARTSQNYSPFRSWDFDACVFVHFDAATYEVADAVEVPAETIRALTTPDGHVGQQARRLTVANLRKARAAATALEASLAVVSPYRDITPALREAMCRLPG